MPAVLQSSALEPPVRRAIQAAMGRVGMVADATSDLPPSSPVGTLAYSRDTGMLYVFDGTWTPVVGAWA